ncbi:MAG: nitronate monooxygenase [Alicyclobacillus macrosporangiidus]|uniref:nitronate monooxygenase n=1 Tax=Alicyclobacillus macrosporangiidus TaxID=392015 RepID=UPI0026F0AC34|nr:nitronate monooxygenase [Alicyclobacillus macrosporangiidus]MCL6600187.1 nitronate monooxygenase [Alicyclobacillus macrosporangiidus]
MKTKVTEMFGIDVPIFAFNHCRDVVVEVSKAGGFGVLGASGYTPDELEQELRWIDDHVGGRPYGVDLLMPAKVQRDVAGERKFAIDQMISAEHKKFVNDILDQADIPPLPEDQRDEIMKELIRHVQVQPEDAEVLLDVAYQHPIKLVVSALGAPPKHQVERAHSMGIKVGALAGNLHHAMRHKEAGVDLVVAQGSEAGGHTGKITSMILWPELAEALDPIPVLATGGVGRGNQMAAALVMGAAGVWCGSIWLGTRESNYTPLEKEILFEARAEDTVQSSHVTGKPVRMVRSKMSDAWAQPGAPETLGTPRQLILMREPMARIERAGDRGRDYMNPIVGQVVEFMKKETTTRRVIEDMLVEFVQAVERLNDIVADHVEEV